MNSITPNNRTFNPQSKTAVYQSIAATNIRRGEGDIIATCDLKVGGLLIHHVVVRRGRNDSTFVNLPSIRPNGHWIDVVEITSPQLRDACRQVVLAAVAEVLR